MGVTLLTGGTGFVGLCVARELVARGDDVRVVARQGARVERLEGLDVSIFGADVLDRRSIRRAMRDVTKVFHVAGSTSLRKRAAELDRINVEGTRIVLEEALRAGVERCVHTSAAGAIGPAPRGTTADETQHFSGEAGRIPFVNSKREAEHVALRLAARGLPVVIVNPTFVFGAGDYGRSSTELVRRFLRRELPVYVDGTVNVVDVADVARGHLLADEHGEVGERYILGGRNFTLDRLFADLGRISGIEPPALKLPRTPAVAFAELGDALPLPMPLSPVEAYAVSLNWAFRTTKAKRELGFTTLPHEETLEKTVDWYRSREPDSIAEPGARQPLPLRAAGFAARRLGVLGGWNVP